MYFNMLIFILLFGLAQGILLVSVLLAQKRIHTFHIFLSGYIAVLLLQVVFKVLDKMWLMDVLLQPYLLSYYLPFLYGPLLFLFSQSYLKKDFKFRWKHALHFIPFMLFMVFYGLANPGTYPPAIILFLFNPLTRFNLQVISIVAYHIFIFNFLHHAIKRNELNMIYKIRSVFLKKLSVASLIITIGIATTLFFLYINFPNYQNVRWLFALLTIFIYWISYEALKKPELFKVIYGNAATQDYTYLMPQLVAHRPPIKYSNSSLKEDEVHRISAALVKSMEVDKIYLDSNLNIEMLASLLCCQKHHLSQILNEKFHLSFNEFINQKRIAEAKVFLADPNFGHFKIASIAYEAGFNSLSSFNDTFKKLEKATPSQYRSMIQHQNQSRIRRM